MTIRRQQHASHHRKRQISSWWIVVKVRPGIHPRARDWALFWLVSWLQDTSIGQPFSWLVLHISVRWKCTWIYDSEAFPRSVCPAQFGDSVIRTWLVSLGSRISDFVTLPSSQVVNLVFLLVWLAKLDFNLTFSIVFRHAGIHSYDGWWRAEMRSTTCFLADILIRCLNRLHTFQRGTCSTIADDGVQDTPMVCRWQFFHRFTVRWPF